MGTTAFVGRRFQGNIEGFSMSGNGGYDCVGVDVLTKFYELTKEELVDFLVHRVIYLDPETSDETEQLRIEDLCENVYDIWNIDWKTDIIEVENSNALTGKGILSREYGYLFDLDNDTVEIYNQGDYDDQWQWIDGPHKLMFTVTRSNLERVQQLFTHNYELYDHYNTEGYEQIFLQLSDAEAQEVLAKVTQPSQESPDEHRSLDRSSIASRMFEKNEEN